ncbi:MAG: hypothetical protein ABIO80_02890 [Sphingomicrobium sp.]
MIFARARAMLLGLAALLAAGVLVWSLRAPPPAVERPRLLLLTSLPLMFGESVSLDGNGSPAMSALQSRYRVVPISVTSQNELAKGRLLLMAQPLAQPAEDLVALDAWVRGGGRLLLLADPLLEWPSKRPLGDPLRPPPMFMDTGLLAHWGLRLDAPDKPGPVALGGAHESIVFLSPGRLVSTNPDCQLSRANILADCRIGQGRATIIADADFLHPEFDEPASHNLEAVLGELDSLNR